MRCHRSPTGSRVSSERDLQRKPGMIGSMIRRITSHTRGLKSAMGTYLLLGMGMSVAATAGFAWIARAVAGGVGRDVDTATVVWLRSQNAPAWDALALAGAALGSGPALGGALVIGSVWFARTRHLYSLALLWVALAGGHVLNGTLKQLFDRPRPGLTYGGELVILGRTFEYPTSYSFPSGHAVTAVVVFGTLAWLVVRLEPTVRIRRITIAGAVALILVIGVSRVYLGVHYPSDVLAGYLAGFIWATTAAFAIEVLRYTIGHRRYARGLERGLEKGMDPARDALTGDPS